MAMTELSRSISRDAMLCDGTPRHERGWRAHVMVDTGQPNPKCPPPPYGPTLRRLHVSPLLPTRAAAEAWRPDEVAA